VELSSLTIYIPNPSEAPRLPPTILNRMDKKKTQLGPSKTCFQLMPTAIKPTGTFTCPPFSTPTTPPSTPSQDTRPFSSFTGGKQEDYVHQLHDRTFAEYIFELQNIIYCRESKDARTETHPTTSPPSHPTSAPVLASWLIFQALNSTTSYPDDFTSCKTDTPSQTSWYVNYLR
jgi:hypothetical protein